MSRLPNVGGDDNTWGSILNDFLGVEHNADGSQKTLDVTKGGTGATNVATARNNLGAISDTDPRLSDARTPTAHAASHEPGGSDPVTIDLAHVSDAGTAAALDVDTDGTLATNSDTALTSQKAVKSYIDGQNPSLAWLVVDGNKVREGAGGPIYKAAGYNIHIAPNEYGASQTLDTDQLIKYFEQMPEGSLSRFRAYCPNPSVTTWAEQLATFDIAVAAAKARSNRLIFCLTEWGSNPDEAYADIFMPKDVSWVTGQQYLHSVYGNNSYEDWVKYLAAHYANEPTVAIYDICNEPQDDGSNTAAFKTWFETTRGWIQALAPSALVYVGTDSQMGGATNFQSLMANMDLCAAHYYDVLGFIAGNNPDITNARALGKPWIADEFGVYAKRYYGSVDDPDLDDMGWPAVDYEAQGRLVEALLDCFFGFDDCVGALLYSYMDSDGGGYTDGLGHYEPLNESPARRAIREADLYGQRFSADTLTNITGSRAWLDGATAFMFPPGAEMVPTGRQSFGFRPSYGGSTSALAGRWDKRASMLFDGARYYDDAIWKLGDAQSTHYLAFVPTSLPAAGAYAYLLAPQTVTASLALRLNPAGQVELLIYATPTTGTVISTSSNAVNLGSPNTLAVSYNTSGVCQIIFNGVRTTATSAQSLGAANARIGVAQDGSNGFVGHLLQGIQQNIVETDQNIGKVLAWFQRLYGVV